MYGIAQSRDVPAAKAVLNNVMVPEFVPQRGVKIQVNEAEAAAAAAGGDVDEMQLDSIAAALPERSSLAKLSPVEFEKDDETYASFSSVQSCVVLCFGIRDLLLFSTLDVVDR